VWEVRTTDTFQEIFGIPEKIPREVSCMARTLDQILETEKPEVVSAARAKAEAILLNIHLAEIRSLMEKTQIEMAEALRVKQPTVAGMEKAGKDLKLSSLKRYIEAGGGKVRLDIELPDGRHHCFVL